MDLSSVDLLKRCLHRQTQKNEVNNNRVILKQCARNEIFGPTTLEIGLVCALISFIVMVILAFMKVFKILKLNQANVAHRKCQH